MGLPRTSRLVIGRAAVVLLSLAAIAEAQTSRAETTGQAPTDTPAPTEPARMCVRGEPLASSSCRGPQEVDALLRDETLDILAARPTPGGSQGAHVLTLRSGASDIVFEAKWRPWTSAESYTDPVTPLAAHRAQQMVLSPRDWVVPPAAAHCFALDDYREQFGDEAQPFPGTYCVLGVLSFWLQDSVTLRDARRQGWMPAPEGVWSADPALFDRGRFLREPRYGRAVSNLNVVAHLIRNRDAHTAQFVLYREPFHVFLVDNSVAFGVSGNSEMTSRENFAELIVPAVPAETARRILSVQGQDVRALRTLVACRRTHQGLEASAPGSPFGAPGERVRTDGARVQLGLTSSEVEGLLHRVRALQRGLREGRLRTFE